MAEQETPRETLERLGASKVRFMLSSRMLSQNHIGPAIQWLAELDDEERSRNDASQAAQYRTARIAKNAAIVAAIAATVTIPLAIISIVMTYLAWIYPTR